MFRAPELTFETLYHIVFIDPQLQKEAVFMERFKALDVYSKIVLILMLVLPVVFLPFYIKAPTSNNVRFQRRGRCPHRPVGYDAGAVR